MRVTIDEIQADHRVVAAERDLKIGAGRHHWTVEVEGRPALHLNLDMSDPPGTGLRTKAGQYVTAGAVINAIPAVVAAPPGLFAPPVFAPFTRP